jgi:predicted HD phosphohydrolase
MHLGGPRLFRDMDRAPADDRSPGCARAEFRQGHPNRHRKALLFRFRNGPKIRQFCWNLRRRSSMEK